MISKTELRDIYISFREAIEDVKIEHGFYSSNPSKDRMCNFPKECCDDTADLLGYFLAHDYREKIHTKR